MRKKIENCKNNHEREVLQKQYDKYLSPILLKDSHGGIAPDNASALIYTEEDDHIALRYLTPEKPDRENR